MTDPQTFSDSYVKQASGAVPVKVPDFKGDTMVTNWERRSRFPSGQGCSRDFNIVRVFHSPRYYFILDDTYVLGTVGYNWFNLI